MRSFYAITLGVGWGFIGHEFHLKYPITIVAILMTFALVFYIGKVVEDERRS